MAQERRTDVAAGSGATLTLRSETVGHLIVPNNGTTASLQLSRTLGMDNGAFRVSMKRVRADAGAVRPRQGMSVRERAGCGRRWRRDVGPVAVLVPVIRGLDCARTCHQDGITPGVCRGMRRRAVHRRHDDV